MANYVLEANKLMYTLSIPITICSFLSLFSFISSLLFLLKNIFKSINLNWEQHKGVSREAQENERNSRSYCLRFKII